MFKNFLLNKGEISAIKKNLNYLNYAENVNNLEDAEIIQQNSKNDSQENEYEGMFLKKELF